MKLLFLILDGASDLPQKLLNNKTPLEAAKMPNTDKLLKKSKTGIMSIIGGLPPESGTAAMSLLGYDVYKYYTGRGPLEALGMNIPFEKGWIVLRANFGIVKNGKIMSVRSKLTDDEYKKVVKKINKIKLSCDFKLHHTYGYRGVLILKSKSLDPNITNTQTGYKVKKIKNTRIGVPVPVMPKAVKSRSLIDNEKAKKTAEIINEFTKKTHELLKNEKFNYILLRGAGNKPTKLPDINEKTGLKWGMIAHAPVEKGIAKACGMRLIPSKEELESLAETVKKAFKNYSAVYVHVKGPDKYAHLKEPVLKMKELEKIDKKLIKKIMMIKDLRIIITADHTTSSSLGVHTGNPVPVLASNHEGDGIKKFCEKECKKGSMGLIDAHNLLKIIIKP